MNKSPEQIVLDEKYAAAFAAQQLATKKLEELGKQLDELKEAKKPFYYVGQIGWFSNLKDEVNTLEDRYDVLVGIMPDQQFKFETDAHWYKHFTPDPDADNWIGWDGGECPVEPGTSGFVLFRDGAHYRDDMTCWAWSEAGGIIAYRPTKEPKVL